MGDKLISAMNFVARMNDFSATARKYEIPHSTLLQEAFAYPKFKSGSDISMTSANKECSVSQYSQRVRNRLLWNTVCGPVRGHK